MIDCSSTLGLMYDKIDRVLDRQDQERLEAHLGSCPRCVREYEDILTLHSLYASQELVDPAVDLTGKVLSEITANAEGIARGRERRFGWKRAAAFAQAAMASALIYFSAYYFLGSKPWRSGFRFSWQILAVDVSFLRSVSLPEISVFIPGLTGAAQALASFWQIFAANLQPNLLASIACLLVLQAIGNKLLFSSIRT